MITKLFFLTALILFSTSSIAQNKNVIDYYKTLPDSLKKGYNLSFSNNKWMSSSCADYEIFPTVDIKNGYIEIYDEGTGGGISVLKVVLYRKANSKGLIGVSYYQGDFIDADCSIYFLEYNNDKWEIANNKILPDISYKNFMNSKYKLSKNLLGKFSIYYNLPQHGPTITLNLKYNLIRMFCEGAFSNTSEKEKLESCKFIENIKTDSLQLFWDKKNTKFFLK
jgi:hypothetical protein